MSSVLLLLPSLNNCVVLIEEKMRRSWFGWDQAQRCISRPLLLIKAKRLQTRLKPNPSTGKFCLGEGKALLLKMRGRFPWILNQRAAMKTAQLFSIPR